MMQTHLEVQRQDIRRDLAERMKFVPPDLRAQEHVFYWQEDLSKLKVEIIAVATVFQANISKLGGRGGETRGGEGDRWTLWIWKNFRTRGERAGAPVLWLSCEGQN